MKLNIFTKTEHSDIATAVAWSPDSQLFSCSDDKEICKWSAEGEAAGKFSVNNAYISSISWFPTLGKQTADMFAVSCTDGTFRFFSRSGREEKKIAAHEGAVILVRWCHDGSALLSAGEDGDVKIWSRSGNMRSVLTSTGQAVYCACWGPDDDQVVIGNGNNLLIKTVQTTRKNIQWKAHEGIVLCVDWNVTNQCLVSGGEDCTYRVWDSFGRQLYASKPLEQVITSVGWSPNGDVFAVGSHNVVRLCDKTGWAHSKHRHTAGSVLNLCWTSDGTQFAGATGSGAILFAQLVGRLFEWKNYEVTLVEPRKIRVQDSANENLEDIMFPRDRVVEIGVGYDYLVVTTTSQCHIYSLQNLNTPNIFDIKSPPHFLHMCKRHFLTLDLISGIQVITYEGRVSSNLKFQGFKPEYLNRDMVALSPDTVAVVDTVDKKLVHILDPMSGRVMGKLNHSAEVLKVGLNQHSLGPSDRILTFVDRNRDMFVAQLGVLTGGGNASTAIPTYKLHPHVESFAFNDETDALAFLSDGKLLVSYYPTTPFIDKDLIASTQTTLDNIEVGRNGEIMSYTASRICIRKVDGAMLFSSTPTDIDLLYELGRAGRWNECVRLCRHQKSDLLWATLAVMALNKKHLDTVETCLAELNEVAKVEYIQYIKQIPSEEGRQAELALYRRVPMESERILLQASPPLVFRAIMLNIDLYRWSRALDIALKYRSHVDTVLGYRQRYIEQFGKRETDQRFLQYANQVTVDWDAIEAKIQKELDDEASRAIGGGRK